MAHRPSLIDTVSRELIERYAALVEAAAEQSLEEGLCGVLVVWVDGEVSAAPDMRVPYGTIYEHQGDPATFRGVTHIRV